MARKIIHRWRLQVGLCFITATLAGLDPAFSEQSTVELQNALLKTIEATSVAAEVVGKVQHFVVEPGDTVEVGQPLGKVRDSAVKLQLTGAKIALAMARKRAESDIELRLAQKRAEVAANELERAEAANKQIADTYPPKEIDRLRLVAVSAELEIERAENDRQLAASEVTAAENAYHQAKEHLSRHVILAPVDGVVVSVNRRVGEWVEPGTEFLQIIKIHRLRIEGFIDSSSIEQDLVGHAADVTVLNGDKEISINGEVAFISPDTNPVSGLVRVHLEIDNAEKKFLPGMRVRATIRQDSK